MPTAVESKLDIIVALPLESIRANPYQPASRMVIEDAIAERIGKSILQHGLIQNPIVRKEKHKPETLMEIFTVSDPYHYEMGDGWIRLHGYLWLVRNGHPEYNEMPCIVRDLTDQQMADLIMESQVRQDMNAIERAEFYKKYLEDFGGTQAELAKRHDVSQGEIANTIRLLELPAEIRSQVISQEIPETHARHLLRLNYNPSLQADMVNRCILNKSSASQLDNDISNAMYNNSKPLDARYSWGEDKLNFDPSGTLPNCDKCESRKKLSYYSNTKEWRCLNPECWERKRQAAAEIQRQKEIKDAAIAGETHVYTEDSLRGKPHETIRSDRINEAECEGCKNHVRAETWKGHFDNVCLDPKCYRSRQLKATKERNRKAKDDAATLTERISKLARERIVKHDAETSFWIVLEALARTSNYNEKLSTEVADMLGCRKDARKKVSREEFLKVFETHIYNFEQVAVAAALTAIRQTTPDGDKHNRYLNRAIALLEGRLNEYDDLLASLPDRQCKDCSCKSAGVDGRICWKGGDIDDDGICQKYRKREIVSATEEEEEA